MGLGRLDEELDQIQSDRMCEDGRDLVCGSNNVEMSVTRRCNGAANDEEGEADQHSNTRPTELE